MQTFSFSPTLNLIEEGKWFLAVTSFEATNFVFNINIENNNFSISTPSHWSSEEGEGFINKLKRMLKARSEYDIERHGVKKKGDQRKRGDRENKLSDLDTRKNEILKELKNIEYNDLEDMVFKLEIT